MTTGKGRGARAARLRVAGHVTATAARSAAPDPHAIRLAGEYGNFPSERIMALCILGKGGEWELYHCDQYLNRGGKSDDPACTGSIPLGTLTLTGPCLKRDKETG